MLLQYKSIVSMFFIFPNQSHLADNFSTKIRKIFLCKSWTPILECSNKGNVYDNYVQNSIQKFEEQYGPFI